MAKRKYENQWANEDLSNVPVVEGEPTPILPDEDEWDTLPDNAVKYVINNNQFTGIPLSPGKYEIVTRNNIEGTQKGQQVVYIADNPAGNNPIRLTKDFIFETTGRTAIYIKGQSDIDVAIINLANELGKKADKADTYTKAQVDELIANGVGGVTNVFKYKGKLANLSAIQAVQNPSVGDCYQAKDTTIFYVWVEDLDIADGRWEALSGSIINLTNYYTKNEANVLLQDKTNKSDFDALRAQVDIIENRTHPFNYIQDTDPSLPEPDRTQQGEVWFNPVDGSIKVRREDEQDNSLFWYDSTENVKIALAGDFLTIKTNQNIQGIKNFNVLPTSNLSATNDEQFITYGQAKKEFSGGGTGHLPENLLYNNTDATIEANFDFTQGNIEVAEPTVDNHPVNLKYFNENSSRFTPIVVEDPQLEDSDNTEKGIKMYKIPLEGKMGLVLGAYKQNTSNNSIDLIYFDNIIKNDNLVIYTDSNRIKKIVYFTFEG